MREILVSDTQEGPEKQTQLAIAPYPLNVCFHITTSNPDTVMICSRAETRPVIDLDLFYAPVRPHAKTVRPPKQPAAGFVFFPLRDKLKTVEEASVSIVGGSRQGTLQQLV